MKDAKTEAGDAHPNPIEVLHWRVARRWLLTGGVFAALWYLAPSTSWSASVLILFLGRSAAEVPFPRTSVAFLALLMVAMLLSLLALGLNVLAPKDTPVVHVALVAVTIVFAAFAVLSDTVTIIRSLRRPSHA
jgi:hypothetical protein